MDRRFHWRLTLAAPALALAAFPALAAEGRMPLWRQTVLGPGVTQGKFIVTRDIVVPPGGGIALAIIGGPGFEHADIDLNGFTIFGDPAGGAHVIAASGLRSLTIRNGEVRHLAPGADAIRASLVDRVVIEDVKAVEGGIGIYLVEVLDFALRRNVIVGSDLHGILVDGNGAFIEGTIEGNHVLDALAGGIEVMNGFSSLSIRNNRVESVAGGHGIGVFAGSNALIAENTVGGADLAGIRVEACSNGKVYNNVVDRSGVGISVVASGFLVLDNVSSSNHGTGLFIGGSFNHVDRNVLNLNGGFGMHFGPASADNIYQDNSARGNAGGPCAFAAPVEPCPFGGGGSFPPDFCNESPGGGNTSRCDNLMPGPPLS